MFVVTADQRRSRSDRDRVEDVLKELSNTFTAGQVRSFERTAGDEVQGILDNPQTVVDLGLFLSGTEQWSVGIGVGPVREPLPKSARAGAGPAFEHARTAVTAAKHAPGHIAVRGEGPLCQDVDALLQLLAVLALRRSPAVTEAGLLLQQGLSQRQAAEQLGITQQAVSGRLRTGLWSESERVKASAVRLLGEADR